MAVAACCLTMMRLLVVVVLLLLLQCHAQEDDVENVDLEKCFDALRDSDVNQDFKVNSTEHLVFLEQFGPPGFLSEYEERPLALRAKFHLAACLCLQRGGDATCCSGDNAAIDIAGVQQGASEEEQEYVETVCVLTHRAIQAVQTEETAAPAETTTEAPSPTQAQEAYTSVWLQTMYPVAVSEEGDDFLGELMAAMNVLVPEVLQEETSGSTRRRRYLQGGAVESLPTRVEATPTDCPTSSTATATRQSLYCHDITTITYVVGPSNLLNETQLEGALDTAIQEGRLQEILGPSSSIQVLGDDTMTPLDEGKPADEDDPPTDPPTTVGAGGDDSSTNNGDDDNNSAWSAGAIVGVASAGCALVALIAGLAYMRKRNQYLEEIKKSAQDSDAIMLVDQQSEPSRDVYIENSEHDVEKGSFRNMDQVGMEAFQDEPVVINDDDEIPVPPMADDESTGLIVVPGLLSSRKEPSDGDLGASYGNHVDSISSFSQSQVPSSNASSGGVGSMTPVAYGVAMGLSDSREFESDDSDEYSSSSSSSSSSSDSASDITEDDVSEAGSESSSESEDSDYGPSKRELQERAKSKNTLDTTATYTSEDNLFASPVAAAAAASTIDRAAVEPAAVEPAAIEPATTVQSAPPPPPPPPPPPEPEPSTSNAVPTTSNAVPPAGESGPSAGLIAGVTVGAVGAVAAGGAAIYAATRKKDDEDENKEEPPPPEMQSESAIEDGGAIRPSGTGVAVAGAMDSYSHSTIDDPVAAGEESTMGGLSFAAIHDPSAVDESESEESDTDESTDSESDTDESTDSESDTDESTDSESDTDKSTDSGSDDSDDEESGTHDGSQMTSTFYEDSTVTTNPSVSEGGLSAGTAAAVGAGAVGVGATAAYLASLGDENSESVVESSTDEGRSFDSQQAIGSSGAPPQPYERQRPPASGKDHPYYAAAAAMAAGSAGAAAVYDKSKDRVGEESGDESYTVQQSSSGQDASTSDEGLSDGIPHSGMQQMQISPDEVPVTQEDDSVALAIGAGAATAAALTVATKANDSLEKLDDTETQKDLATSNQPQTGGSAAGAAPPLASSADHATKAPDESSLAAAIGAGALTAVALSTATQVARSNDETSESDDSYSTESESGSESSSGDSSLEGATDAATLGTRTDSKSTVDTRLNSSGTPTLARSSSTGVPSSSNRSVDTDAAVATSVVTSLPSQSDNVSSLSGQAPSSSNLDGSFESDAAIVGARSESRSTLGSLVDSSTPGRSSSTTGPSLSSGSMGPAVAAPASPSDDSIPSSSPAVAQSSQPNVATRDTAPKTGIIAGVAAGGAAIGAAALYAFSRDNAVDEESESGSESESESEDERTTDEESSGDEDSEGGVTNVALAGSRSVSKSTLETGSLRSLQEQGDSTRGFFGRDSSEHRLQRPGMVAGTSVATIGGSQVSFTGTYSAPLAESGDTFLAMEEAAQTDTPKDIVVAKSRFDVPPQQANKPEAVPQAAVGAAVGAAAVGVGAAAVAASARNRESQSQDKVEESSDEEDYTSASDSESESDSESSESDSSSSSDSESDSNSESSSDSESDSDSDSSSESGSSESSEDVEDRPVTDQPVNVPVHPVAPADAAGGPQTPTKAQASRAAMLRARSDAALPATPKSETVASMLTEWDEDYDINGDGTGEQDFESLVVEDASAGLAPIEETGGSDESSQEVSFQSSQDISFSDDKTASVPYSSSTLLNFDYSLNTIQEQEDGVYEESSESSSPRADFDEGIFVHVAAVGPPGLTAISEKGESSVNVVKSITADEDVEAQEGPSRLLGSAMEAVRDDSSDSESSSESDSSESSDDESSEYTTDSESSSGESGSSASSTSSGGSEYSTTSSTTEESDSSSSSTPEPSTPNIVHPPNNTESMGPLKGNEKSRPVEEVKPTENRDTAVPSEAWAAIAESNMVNDKGAIDAAEWAIERSLSALQHAESCASSLTQSHGSLSAQGDRDRDLLPRDTPSPSSSDDEEVEC